MKTKVITVLSAILVLSVSSLGAGQTAVRRAAQDATPQIVMNCLVCSNAQSRAESCQGESKAKCAASVEAEGSNCLVANSRGRTAKGRPAVAMRDHHSAKCMFSAKSGK